MRSIELTFAEPDDTAVRTAWTALADAGLPSLASHRSPSNRPHVTLAAGDTLPEPEDVPALPALPRSVLLGGTLLFPGGPDRVVLVRAVVVDDDLAAFHRAVHAGSPDALPTTVPGRWSPHVTLAHRLRITDLPAALAALAEVELPDELTLDGVRHWDGVTKTVTPLTSR